MQVVQATLELRTIRLTKSILMQIPKLERLPKDSYDPEGNILPEKAVGWVHGSVLGDKWATAIIFILPGEGEFGVYMYPGGQKPKNLKQIYVA